MKTDTFEKANDLIEKVLQIKKQMYHQEIALKCMRKQSEEVEMIDIITDISGHPIVFKVPIDEMKLLAELAIVNQKALITKLKDELEKL